jgi:hypothetical protein
MTYAIRMYQVEIVKIVDNSIFGIMSKETHDKIDEVKKIK